jgi:hypothetical protein
MVRYTLMKRLTQLLASIFFIFTVLTVYLAFDYAVNNVMEQKTVTIKHRYIHIDKQLPSTFMPITSNNHTTTLNRQRRVRHTKSIDANRRVASFHKSKTGIKHRHVRKPIKHSRKPLSNKGHKILQTDEQI